MSLGFRVSVQGSGIWVHEFVKDIAQPMSQAWDVPNTAVL